MTKSTKTHAVTWSDGIPTVKLSGFQPHTYPDGMPVTRLLASGDGNTKTRKNVGYLSAGLSLSAHKSAGVGNVCPHASAGCIAGCLNGQGLASVFETIAYVRQAKTALWYEAREWFLSTLREDLSRWVRKANRAEMPLCVRLNMFSDIPWEKYCVPQQFSDIEFYDYTKNRNRAGALLHNYWVTFSRSEVNEDDTSSALDCGANVAVVFYQDGKFTGNRASFQRLPKTWHGYRVIDGDTTDLRFDDPRGRKRGCVVGLRLKSHDNATREAMIDSGFGVRVR
jgi:hypothetical protein